MVQWKPWIWGGLDTFLYAYEYLYRKFGDKFRPPNLLRRNVENDRLGVKTGKGFYEYTPASFEALTKRRDQWILSLLKEDKLKDNVGNPPSQ